MRRWCAAAWCALAVAGGCAGAPPVTGGPVEGLAELPPLPPCTEDLPAPSGDELPPGARVPDGTVVTVVRETGPFTQVNGYVPQTPLEIKAVYEAFEDLEVLVDEHEVVEAELLVTDGEYRSFVKAVSVCDAGSALAVVIAPESEADVLPAPARAGEQD